MLESLHQRGANGLIAEYQCAVRLNELVTAAGFQTRASQRELEDARDAARTRVANELSEAQINRSLGQGDALGFYLFEGLTSHPSRLALDAPALVDISDEFDVATTGRWTNSGSSADLTVSTYRRFASTTIPVSLKAYRSSTTSLGSKGSLASLNRLFLQHPKPAKADFVDHFGQPAQNFIDTLADFRAVCKEYYLSDAGIAFIDEYEARKGSRNVNNPYRRKEVGDYFEALRGYKSEHRFADLYVQMVQSGMEQLLRHGSPGDWDEFLIGLRFILGMENDILVLNAVADDAGTVHRIENSFLSDAYSSIRSALQPGCELLLTHRAGSSIIGVRLRFDETVVSCLSLAMWKDATIQFKLDGRDFE